MVPAGEPTEQTVTTLGDLLERRRRDHRRRQLLLQGRRPPRARRSAPKGIHYVDVGTSGGVWGAERGYCLMVGGPREAVARLEPIFATLAPGEAGIPPLARTRRQGEHRGERATCTAVRPAPATS